VSRKVNKTAYLELVPKNAKYPSNIFSFY